MAAFSVIVIATCPFQTVMPLKRVRKRGAEEHASDGLTAPKRSYKNEFDRKLGEGKRRVRDIPVDRQLTFEELKSNPAWGDVESGQLPAPDVISKCVRAFANYAAKNRKPPGERQEAYNRWKPFWDKLKKRLEEVLEEDDVTLAHGVHGRLMCASAPNGNDLKASGK